MVGRTIAERYLLEEHLGTGGMGEVWRATDLQLQETVALKRPREGDAGHEARIGAELSHPNVITVHGTVNDGAEQWLVMEYLPSRSLSEIIEADGPITPHRATKIGAQLADALAAMHAKGMVHRDVKPGNVLVTDNDVAKLSDFGISRWAEQTRVGGGDVAGTAAYLAPEVADGHEARPASDVFALGATLFAAVEGTSPWGSPDAGSSEQLRRAKAYDITPAQHDSPFGDLLAQLMRRDPQDRPATENVRPLLEGVKLPNPRRRKAVIIGAAALVAVVAAAAVIYSRLPVAGTVGDPRSMDVCGLTASKDDFRRFTPDHVETNALNSYWFNGCTSWVAFDAKGDDGLVVDYFVKQFVQFGAAKPSGKLGAVTQIGSTENVCTKSIVLVDGNSLQIEAKGGPSQPLCDIAQVAGERAHAVLTESQIPRLKEVWPKESLANADACSLLKPENLEPQLKSAATPYPWGELGSWGCGWDYELRTVEVEFSRQQPFNAEDGTVIDVGRGLLAYLDPDTEEGECQVKIQHRVAKEGNEDDRRIEVVRVMLREQKLTEGTSLCPGATELAKAVVPRLP